MRSKKMPRLPLYLRRRCSRCQACEPASRAARSPRRCRCQAYEPAVQPARRRYRFIAPQRFDGRRFGRRNAGGYRAHRPGMGRFCGQNFPNRRGSAPATGVAPLPTPVAPQEPAVPERLLNGSAQPPLPAFCPLHGHDSAAGVDAVGLSPTSVFEFGSTSAALVDIFTVVPPPRLPSPTPAVVEIEGDALAYVSAPTGASIFTLGSGVRSVTSVPAAPTSSSRVHVDAPRLPSLTPATPPPSSPAAAHRRLQALGLPLASPSADSPTSTRGHRAGNWSPAALGLAKGGSNGVASGTWLPRGSSDEEEGGRSAARRW